VAHTLPDDAFRAWLEARGGIPPELLAAPELLALLLPRIRADLALYAGYRCALEPPLACALTALGGAEDPDTDERTLEAWRDVTTGAFQRRLFPGRHFFVGAHRAAIIQLVAEAILTSPSA
jgi:medium-chain acyl-[acyl-carrier-protein] hydrolase